MDGTELALVLLTIVVVINSAVLLHLLAERLREIEARLQRTPRSTPDTSVRLDTQDWRKVAPGGRPRL